MSFRFFIFDTILYRTHFISYFNRGLCVYYTPCPEKRGHSLFLHNFNKINVDRVS